MLLERSPTSHASRASIPGRIPVTSKVEHRAANMASGGERFFNYLVKYDVRMLILTAVG